MTSLPARAWRFLVQPRGRPVHPFHRLAHRARGSRSGVALVVVIASIVVMTTVVSEMAFQVRVRFLLSGHQLQQAQAYWLACTGVNIYRLILTGNYQLKQSSVMQTVGQATGVNMGDALWQAVPFLSSGLMRMVFVSGGSADELDEQDAQELRTRGTVSEEIAEASREKSRFSDEGFLDFEGDFSAQIVDEERKINVNAFARRGTATALQENVTAQALYGLMSGIENDQWFYDRNIDRWEIIANLADWVDADTTRCGLEGGYEDDLYNRLEDPYLSKNASFDTKDEIRLVAGWEGEVFDRYEDRLTVWGSGKINVNTADREVLVGLLRAYASTSDDLANTMVDLLDQYAMVTSFQSTKDFTSYLEAQGIQVSDELKNVITTSSSVFTVTSMGVVGTTTVTLTAVLDYSSSPLGITKYWRVD
ncbi:MAG: general secretion pathway protein GspK [Deltaproteobacteria bacterium]|nr:general secretion pathway protein GspK [Deltaproteobacteria bacterium]